VWCTVARAISQIYQNHTFEHRFILLSLFIALFHIVYHCFTLYITVYSTVSHSSSKRRPPPLLCKSHKRFATISNAISFYCDFLKYLTIHLIYFKKISHILL
jgi:hypothetical protein